MPMARGGGIGRDLDDGDADLAFWVDDGTRRRWKTGKSTLRAQIGAPCCSSRYPLLCFCALFVGGNHSQTYFCRTIISVIAPVKPGRMEREMTSGLFGSTIGEQKN